MADEPIDRDTLEALCESSLLAIGTALPAELGIIVIMWTPGVGISVCSSMDESESRRVLSAVAQLSHYKPSRPLH